MKKLMLSTAILGAFATASFAQSTDATTPMVGAATTEMTSPFRADADPMTVAASDFIGMRVYASEAALEAEEYAGLQDGWEDIGEINDVIIARDGSVEAVLVDIGGFLGIGERQVAVDMKAVRFVSDSATAEDADDFFLVLNADRAVLEGAPVYGMAPGMTDDTATDQAMTDTETMAPAATATAADAPTDAPATIAVAELTAEELQGAPVYDADNTWIGEVSELVLTPEGQVSEAVIDVGGFLGIGAKPVALDMESVTIAREAGSDDLRLTVAMTKAELEAMPEHAG